MFGAGDLAWSTPRPIGRTRAAFGAGAEKPSSCDVTSGAPSANNRHWRSRPNRSRRMISSFKHASPLVAVCFFALAAAAGLAASSPAAEEAHKVPPPAVDEPAGGSSPEVAVVAGGCFWGVQGVFQHVDGVLGAVSGYDGGAAATAHYDMTSRGNTGHAELVRDRLRSAQDHLRPDLAGLLLGRARSDGAQSAGPGRRHAVPLRHLPSERRAGAGGEGLYRRARSGACLRRADRHQHRTAARPSTAQRPITRTSWREIRPIRTSSITICRSSKT